MNFKEFFSMLKPIKWTHWIGYGTFGAVLISSTIVGVVIATKEDGTEKKNTTTSLKEKDVGQNNPEIKGLPKIKGKQKPLPLETANSINIKNLINALKTQGVLNLEKVVLKLKELKIKVNTKSGTSYKNKIIGNKYGDIDRFVASWNKLSSGQKDKLSRNSFAQLFANKPKNQYDIAHQVEYILLEPSKVKKESTEVNHQINSIKKKVSSKSLVTSTKINATSILGKLNISQKTQFHALVNKYIPNILNPLPTQIAKVFIKNKSGQYMNGNDELIKGSKKYPASFNIKRKYYVIWGLFNQKKEKLINSKTNQPIKFKGWKTNVLGKVDQIAIVNTQKQDRSKTITFVFFKIGPQWIFATDYINYIEASDLKVIKITINNPKDKNSSEVIMNQDFSDLVTYTKVSLAY